MARFSAIGNSKEQLLYPYRIVGSDPRPRLELNEAPETFGGRQLLSVKPPIADLIARLGRVLHELWLTEFEWHSIDVFAPIYDMLCEMMELHGMAFARHGDDWRIVMSDEKVETPALRDFLLFTANESRSNEERQDVL